MTDALSQDPVHVTVEARAHGWRVDHYLSRLFSNYSRALFQKAINEGHILLNGLPVKPSRRLRVNDRLAVRLPEVPDERLVPEDIPLDILYEDEALVVVNKPADMSRTRPSRTFTERWPRPCSSISTSSVMSPASCGPVSCTASTATRPA